MNSSGDMPRIAVIGGGISGLAAAHRLVELSRARHVPIDVRVLEAGPRLGGVIATERDVILEERRARVDNSPDALLSEEIDATLYQNHPYRIPVIGEIQIFDQLTLQDVLEYYRAR